MKRIKISIICMFILGNFIVKCPYCAEVITTVSISHECKINVDTKDIKGPLG